MTTKMTEAMPMGTPTKKRLKSTSGIEKYTKKDRTRAHSRVPHIIRLKLLWRRMMKVKAKVAMMMKAIKRI